jgi:Family of unknown function (DUF5996)
MSAAAWPALPYEDWRETKETLHRFAQIVGKVRMALVPPLNHWWHVTLRPSAHGLTTGPMPAGDRWAEIEFDFVDHHVHVRTSEGRAASIALRDRLPCARFYADLFAALSDVGVEVEILARPFDLGDSPPFAQDTLHDRYDAAAVERFWTVVRRTDEVLARFASGFSGKASPTHRGLLARGHRLRLVARGRAPHAVPGVLLLYRARARRPDRPPARARRRRVDRHRQRLARRPALRRGPGRRRPGGSTAGVLRERLPRRRDGRGLGRLGARPSLSRARQRRR